MCAGRVCAAVRAWRCEIQRGGGCGRGGGGSEVQTAEEQAALELVTNERRRGCRGLA